MNCLDASSLGVSVKQTDSITVNKENQLLEKGVLGEHLHHPLTLLFIVLTLPCKVQKCIAVYRFKCEWHTCSTNVLQKNQGRASINVVGCSWWIHQWWPSAESIHFQLIQHKYLESDGQDSLLLWLTSLSTVIVDSLAEKPQCECANHQWFQHIGRNLALLQIHQQF